MESKMENKKKNKISIPFQIYIIVWFYICLLLYQFGMGFIAVSTASDDCHRDWKIVLDNFSRNAVLFQN